MEIQDFPDYLIYDDGRVWSKPRNTTRGGFRKPIKNTKGYHNVQLCRDGKVSGFLVSRLVAQHYIPNPENKPEVDHIDRNPLNNHVSNLRWATRQENCDNIGMMKTNKSGHKNISYRKSKNRWIFQYRKKGHDVHKMFKTKQDAIHYKFFFLLKLNLQMKHRWHTEAVLDLQ